MGSSAWPAGSRRKRLDEWLRDELPLRFEGRVLPIDPVVADVWGKVVVRSEAAGRPIGAMDASIAATAQTHGMTLVTRNTSDFEASLSRIINPGQRTKSKLHRTNSRSNGSRR